MPTEQRPMVIGPPDLAAAEQARLRHQRLTKPAGSLGRLEDLVLQLAAWQGTSTPQAAPAAMLLFAADHPVAQHGVSAYPPAVTLAMLRNFWAGGAAVNVLAQQREVTLHLHDVGVCGGEQVAASYPGGVHCTRHAVAGHAAGDLRVEDALDAAGFALAWQAGVQAVDALPEATRILLLGEMGIGNTTVAAAVCAALLGGGAAAWVGAGTGVEGEALLRKRTVVAEALQRLAGESQASEVLRRVGGREVVALAAAIGRAAERRMSVLIDGFVVTAAALALVTMQPQARPALIFAHRSAEQAHAAALHHLGAVPLLDLGLRLGEGSGALLALPLLQAACALQRSMATFDSAAVPEREAG